MESARKLGHSPVVATGGAQPAELMNLHEKRRALHDRLTQIDRLLRDARDRQRFCRDPERAAQALADESTYHAELYGLMTRIRAVEGKLLLTRRSCH